MAFPTIPAGTDGRQNGVVTTNSTSWTLTYPTNLASGDLILAFIALDGGSAGLIYPGGWQAKQALSNGASSLAFLAKISNGTETGTFAVTTPNEQGGWRVFRITNWFGGSLGTDGINDADGVRVEITTTGSPTNAPDPPANNPANWDVEDTLWFAACCADTSRTISVYPLADNQSADVSGGATGATLGVCTANDAVASKDPGTFTISASDDWVAATVAVRPAAAVEATPHDPFRSVYGPILAQ